MPIGTGYTGKGTKVFVPGFEKTERAMQSLSQGVLGTKKQEVALARQEAKDFREMMQVDPVVVGNKMLMARQTEAISKFTKEGGDLMRERDGKLNEYDWSSIAASKMELQSNQALWKSNYDRFLRDLNSFQIGRHDPKARQEAIDAYAEGEGEYYGGMLEEMPMDLTDFEREINLLAMGGREMQSELWEQGYETRGGKNIFTSVSKWTEGDARRKIESFVLGNTAATKTAMQIYESMEPMNKESFMNQFDYNDNGMIDEGSGEEKNAVLELMWQQYGEKFMNPRITEKPSAYWQYKETAKSTTSVRANVIRSEKGVGEDGSSFSYGKAASSNYLGTGIPAITFDFSGVVDTKGWIRIPSNTILDIDKSITVNEPTVEARPRASAGGKIEWIAKVPVIRTATAREMAGATASEKKKYSKLEDGSYIYTDIKEIPITTRYEETYSLVDAAFTGFSDLARNKGLDQYIDGESVKGIFFNQ